MSILTRFLGWLYTLSLKLYPPDFQACFGDEMQAVYKQAMIDHSNDGKILIPFLRELKDLPGNLLHQYLSAIRKENSSMATMSSSNDVQNLDSERQPGTWLAAFIAGLPHLIMGLLIGISNTPYVNVSQLSPTAQAIVGIVLAIFVCSNLIVAWRRGWPLWSASWYLYGTWVSVAIIGLTIESFNLEESWRFTNALFFLWIAVCIIGYFLILLKSRLHGLLSVAFLFPILSVMMLEFIPNPIEGWFAICVGLLAALAAGTIVRIGDFRAAFVIVLGFNLVVGLAWAYISEYQMLDLPVGIPKHIPRFANFLEYLVLYSFFGLGVIALPFILRGLVNFGSHRLSS